MVQVSQEASWKNPYSSTPQLCWYLKNADLAGLFSAVSGSTLPHSILGLWLAANTSHSDGASAEALLSVRVARQLRADVRIALEIDRRGSWVYVTWSFDVRRVMPMRHQINVRFWRLLFPAKFRGFLVVPNAPPYYLVELETDAVHEVRGGVYTVDASKTVPSRDGANLADSILPHLYSRPLVFSSLWTSSSASIRIYAPEQEQDPQGHAIHAPSSLGRLQATQPILWKGCLVSQSRTDRDEAAQCTRGLYRSATAQWLREDKLLQRLYENRHAG